MPNIRVKLVLFFLERLLLRREGSAYKRVLKNKYEDDDYEEF
jgi:hypothetical protein